jgi:hypothetical protein
MGAHPRGDGGNAGGGVRKKKPHPPIACKEPLRPTSPADDAIAETLSIIRGRAFGSRATEVKFLKQMLENAGWTPPK